MVIRRGGVNPVITGVTSFVNQLTHAQFFILIKPNDISILVREVFFLLKFSKGTDKQVKYQ